MRTSASCRRNSGERGFTLIEILVVLILVGLMMGVVVPNLEATLRSARFSSQRRTILSELDGLSYRAYITGRPIVLGSPTAGDATPPASPPRYRPPLPAGWRLDIPKPITFAFNGLCSGGRIALIQPDGARETLTLKPPRCGVAMDGR